MSYENVPKNLTEKAVLTRGGRPDYITLSSDPAPVPTTDEAGAIWEHSDTGDRFRWTSTVWVQVAEEGAVINKPTNWALEVAAGRITGLTAKHVYGRNPDIDSATVFEAIWDLGDTYTGFDATSAEVVEIFSDDANDTSAGTGARTVQITGLDGSYNEQTEIVTLNGVTAVNTVNSYIRAPSLEVVTAGPSGHNEGNITARQSTTTANIFSYMTAENNRALNCVYTVPNNKVAYVVSGFASISKKSAADIEAQVRVRYPSSVFQIIEWVSLHSQGSSFINKGFMLFRKPLPTGTDIEIISNSSATNLAVAAGLEILEEDV